MSPQPRVRRHGGGVARAGTVSHMRLRGLAILAACVLAAGTSAAAGGGRPPTRAGRARVPDLPGVERLEPAGQAPARRGELRRDDPRDRDRRLRAPRLRLVPRLRHPVHRRRRARSTPKVRVDVRLRRRVRPRRLSDPGAPQPGVERRRPHPARRQGRLPPLRAVRRERARRRAGRPARAPSGTCAPTACARTAGRRPTPPACRSCPGLVRYDEVAAGAIRHALRFTAEAHGRARTSTPRATTPATPIASLPPMGLRVRLKASVDISHYGKQARVVLQALKTYGMILADNGSNWYISGASDRRYNDDDLHDARQDQGLGLRGRRHLGPAQRLTRGRSPPDRGTPATPGEGTMRAWATSRSLRPPCSFPVVFCLTYFLCVGPRRAHRADAGRRRSRSIAIAIWLDTGGSGGTCGPSCLGRQDAAPVVVVSRARMGRWRSPPAPPSAPGATTSSAQRHEVSSNRRAARRLRRRASHQSARPRAGRTGRRRWRRRARRARRPR